ncbi:hypothetical protein CH380_03070 [Leptospira adleri]|uniref:Uncharacterized protein n=1 Tax=Leptospira adleri TaxID=2023186 RepID=A0A2M9YT51_9LEPT|nr:hypothetical protein CH380_03070 [Leptospira adleri]
MGGGGGLVGKNGRLSTITEKLSLQEESASPHSVGTPTKPGENSLSKKVPVVTTTFFCEMRAEPATRVEGDERLIGSES